MTLEKKILKAFGWRAAFNVELPDKCVACIAPHTSNWDFIFGILFKRAYKIQANFFIKQEWIKFPVGGIIKRLGGIAIHRNKQQSTTDVMAKEFENHKIMRIAITPEGTRRLNSDWKMGFYYIALKASVPIVLISMDYQKKLVEVGKIIFPNGDAEIQLAEIKDYFKNVTPRFPERFKV